MIEDHLISCLFQIIHFALFLAISVCSLLVSEFLFPRNTYSHQDLLYSGSIPTDSIQLTDKHLWEMLSIYSSSCPRQPALILGADVWVDLVLI